MFCRSRRLKFVLSQLVQLQTVTVGLRLVGDSSWTRCTSPADLLPASPMIGCWSSDLSTTLHCIHPTISYYFTFLLYICTYSLQVTKMMLHWKFRRPYSSQCMSEQMRIMRSKELPKELRDRIVATLNSKPALGQGSFQD